MLDSMFSYLVTRGNTHRKGIFKLNEYGLRPVDDYYSSLTLSTETDHGRECPGALTAVDRRGIKAILEKQRHAIPVGLKNRIASGRLELV